MNKAVLKYHSPHKFRHGFAVYALENAKDMGDFKAISQNMMHSNLSITDGIYGVFSEEEVKNRIVGLDSNNSRDILDNEDLLSLLENTIKQLKKSRL